MRRVALGFAAMILAMLVGYTILHGHGTQHSPAHGVRRDADAPNRLVSKVNAPPASGPSVAAPASELLTAANLGDIASQSALCMRAMDAGGVSDDYADAAYWCSRAAERGNAESQASYGRLFQIGKGVAQDPEQAAVWFGKAAEKQNAYAMYMLGRMLVEKNDPADSARGTALLQRAAALGNGSARLTLERLGIAPEKRREQQLLTR
jgi:TPR repeat protein